MPRFAHLRIVMISVWLLLVAGIVMVISQEDRFFAVENRRVATLEDKTGPVQVRSEGLVRWRETVEHQEVFDGDRVATGRSAKVKVMFGERRALGLEGDTQIQITAIVTSHHEPAFMITLVRGSMVAAIDGTCIDCPPIVIRAGNDTYNVSAGNRVGVAKVAGKRAQRFVPRGAWPTARKSTKVASDASNLAGALPTPEDESFEPEPAPTPSPEFTSTPTPMPTPVPKATAKPIGKAALPEVSAPRQGASLYTLLPMASLSNRGIDFPMAPAKLTLTKDMRPALQIVGATEKSAITQVGAGNASSILVPIAKIRRVAAVKSVGLAKDYVFSVRAGLQIGKTKGQSEIFGDKKIDMRIRSFGDYGGGAVTIGMDHWGSAPDGGPWISPKADVAATNAPVVIALAMTADVARCMSAMRDAKQLGLATGGPSSGSGVFIVRDRLVVGELKGSSLDAQTIHAVLLQLQADFVFRGARSAFRATGAASPEALASDVSALLDKGKVLYIMKRDKLYPVSRDFIKTNADVATFIDSQARAIFLEKVEILDIR